jgi:hypothetical protein
VISNKSLIDGLDVVVQEPSKQKQEIAYLKATARKSYEQMGAVSNRLLELLHHLKHDREYKKRTEIALELVQQIEEEDNFPDANYAFDNGVLSLDLTLCIEACGKQWVSELECSRNIQWSGNWVRLDALSSDLRENHPETFRFISVKCRNGETKEYWAFTKVVRLKRYGRKRLVIVHETADLSDPPRYLLTSANHWNSGRTTFIIANIPESTVCYYHHFIALQCVSQPLKEGVLYEILGCALSYGNTAAQERYSCHKIFPPIHPGYVYYHW